MADEEARRAARKLRPCPICNAPADPGLRPFCSKRCAEVDLHRWLSGRYAVPAVEEPEPEEIAAQLAEQLGEPG